MITESTEQAANEAPQELAEPLTVLAPVQVQALAHETDTQGTSGEPETESFRFSGRNGYLVKAGSVPLRFAEPRGWPAPLPDEVRLAFQEKEDDAFATVAPEEITHLTGKAEDSPKPLLEEIIAQALPNQDANKLTAELVIGYLGSMRQESVEAPVRFEPAIYNDGSALATASSQ